MEIKGNWSVKSKPRKKVENSLEELAGQWGVNVDVKITKPFKYTEGPIK